MITLKNLASKSLQEVFDQVANHLLRQRFRSKNGSICAYRSAEGWKCAAGCLIGDDEYNSDMEGKEWKILVEEGMVPKAHAKAIGALQKIHDYGIEADWESELRDFAKGANLEFRICSETH